MKTPRNLKGLWPDEEWPFEEPDGVGLLLKGRANPEVLYVQLMADYGCHPKAAIRIQDRLCRYGSTLCTIRLSVPDAALKTRLAELGIKMTVVPPQLDWKQRFDDGPWENHQLPERLQK